MKYYFLLLLVSALTNAQIPDYYASVDFSQSPENVKSQLATLVRNTHLYHLEYTPQTWTALKEMDRDPQNDENVLMIYGYNDTDALTFNDRSRDKNHTCHTTECEGLWTREHIYPRSIGNYDTDSWPGTDIHALRASDGDMNVYRSNFPYIDGTGNAREIAPYRFYPGDEWKGDVARMLMYMYLRYPSNCQPNWVADDSNTFHADMPDIFLEWNAADPVSAYEIQRNNLSEAEFQGNRNPFIDNPFLATLIWGGPSAENPWSLGLEAVQESEFAVYPNPATEYISYNEHGFNQILIYDVYGRLVGQDRDLQDDRTYLPAESGLYFIKFIRSNEVFTKKILKK